MCCAPILDPFQIQATDHVVDSYPETNFDTAYSLYAGSIIGRGQSFTGDGSDITRARFYLRKNGSPTGNAVAKLYAHAGTFGTNSQPTGAALAVSDNFDVSTLSASMELVEFAFSTPYTLANGTYYVITIEYSGGDASNFPEVGHDTSSATHGGNRSYTSDGSTWNANTGDVVFYVFGG
jgi:hypothetical protein